MRLLLVLLLVAAAATTPLRAADKLWVGLYLGENRETRPEPEAPPKMEERLQPVFGFSHYKLLKGENVDLAGSERWVLARKDFFLRVRPILQPGGSAEKVVYEIYKDGFLIADGTYVVSEDTPLFISGPYFHRGRLIFVLQAK